MLDGQNFVASPNFCSDDADLRFLSSDNVIFKIHSRNLDFASEGFSTTGLSIDASENVPLPEDSETLEKLFDFVYPKRHPDLAGIKLPLLSKVAEAAEKYQVFAAMNICKIRMREAIKDFPVQVFNYAFKHGYSDVVEEAIPHFHQIPLEDIVDALPPELIAPWVKYSERRRSVIMAVFLEDPTSFTLDKEDLSASLSAASGWRPRAAMQQRAQVAMTDRMLADAMRRFYQIHSTGKPIFDLIMEAFKTDSATAVDTAWRGRNVKPPEEFVLKFWGRMEEKLNEIPPFTSMIGL